MLPLEMSSRGGGGAKFFTRQETFSKEIKSTKTRPPPDARQRASATKGPFVAVGSDMWMIWRMVLQFKFGIRDVSLERRYGSEAHEEYKL